MFSQLVRVFGFVAIALVLGIPAQAQVRKPPVNPLAKQFLEKGLDIPGHGFSQLPPPLVNEDMTPKQVQAGLKAAAGTVPFPYFIKGDQRSPVFVDVQPVPKPKEGKRQAHHIFMRMVALGKVEDVVQKNLLNQLIGGAKGNSKPLKPAELAERKLTPLNDKHLAEKFDVLDMELLEKVNISGITRSIKTSGSHSAYSTTILDERFAKDKKYPNAWQHVDVNGKLIGKPSVYSGMGGYVVAVQLPDRKGKDAAVYLEMHYILHEPKGWFGGNEYLASKLRQLVRNNAEEFRRKLTPPK